VEEEEEEEEEEESLFIADAVNWRRRGGGGEVWVGLFDVRSSSNPYRACTVSYGGGGGFIDCL